MPKRTRSASKRKRVGRVSYYEHHGGWHIYYRDGDRQVRRRVADNEEDAERFAAQVNAQLSSSAPTPFTFAPISVADLRGRFLDHHESVVGSSLATVRRYRAATQHLENYVEQNGGPKFAHELKPEQFVKYLRSIQVPPNGHPNTAVRPLRGRGIRYVLEVCRSLYGYAGKHRHLPPYSPNPFSELQIERLKTERSAAVYVFDEKTELAFFRSVGVWAFPIHFVLAKTATRPGELIHLLIEELDLEGGWLQVRNKPALGWTIKTDRERAIPLIPEVVTVLRAVIGERNAGPVFLRQRFQATCPPLGNRTGAALADVYHERLQQLGSQSQEPLSRERQAAVARTVWRDAGCLRAEAVRKSFMKTTKAIGLDGVTCPKSWRHTFATLLQDANVDPLIRQITLGHKPANDANGALGMTGVYTHTRRETQKREIERALRLWPGSLTHALAWINKPGAMAHGPKK